MTKLKTENFGSVRKKNGGRRLLFNYYWANEKPIIKGIDGVLHMALHN